MYILFIYLLFDFVKHHGIIMKSLDFILEKINSFVTLSPLLSYDSVGFLEICFKDDF